VFVTRFWEDTCLFSLAEKICWSYCLYLPLVLVSKLGLKNGFELFESAILGLVSTLEAGFLPKALKGILNLEKALVL